jgi:microcystin-dependent protein
MEPFIGDIEVFAFNFAPVGWLACDGSLQPISQYTSLFNLIGTTYGGDGQTTFALPDLRGRAAIHNGTGPGLSNYLIGQSSGVESVTLTVNQLPAHTHPVTGMNVAGTTGDPTNALWANETSGLGNIYAVPNSPLSMGTQCISPDGGSQPHENRSPVLAVNYCIATDGIYPSQN